MNLIWTIAATTSVEMSTIMGHCIGTFTIVAVILGGVWTFGDDSGERPHHPASDPLTLAVEYRKVHDELGLSPDQVASLRSMLKDRPATASAEEKATEAKRLERVLRPEQVNRLRQLAIQAAPCEALRNDAIAKDLGLSPQQLSELAAVSESQHRKVKDRLSRLNFKTEADREAYIERLRHEEDTQLEHVLTETQRRRFKELQGRPFDFRTEEITPK
jgi:hypothetical protein